MKNINFIEKLFSWASILLILLIPPAIWFLSSLFIYCEIANCGLAGILYFVFLPIFYVIELIVFFLCVFLLNKFSPRKVKEYKIALILSGIVIAMLFFYSTVKSRSSLFNEKYNFLQNDGF